VQLWKANQTTRSGSSNTNPDTMWEKLSKYDIQLKHVHLIWRILEKGLPILENLVKKGIGMNPLCPRCQNQVDD